MKFIHEDFLLETRTARRLYHQFAEAEPILDYHCHLSPRDIVENHLVGVAAMSRRGLQKAFQDHLNRSPGHELHRVRIERAKKLLGDSVYKIEALAPMCGYHSANSFTIAFKQSTGMSPAQFRNKLRH